MLQVTACLDDTKRFTDKVLITIEGGQYLVNLTAIGQGSTLTSDALANGSLHFGTQLSHSIITKPFEISNQGKYIQSVTWDMDTEMKKSPKHVFAFAPLKMAIPPHTSFSFQCTGIICNHDKLYQYLEYFYIILHIKVFDLVLCHKFI